MSQENISRKSLSSNLAKVLFSIWKISGKNTKYATYQEIEEESGFKQSYLRKLIFELNKMPDKRLQSFDVPASNNSEEPKNRKPLTAFCLDPEVVILPETAKILLLLFEAKPTEPHRIKKSEFINDTSKKLNLDKNFVQKRIDVGIESKYIQEISADYIWTGIRLFIELEYLKLVADHFKSEQKAKTSTAAH
jgi:hypothetical protein